MGNFLPPERRKQLVRFFTLTESERVLFIAALGIGALISSPLKVTAVVADGVPLNTPEVSFFTYVRSYGNSSSWLKFILTRETSSEFSRFIVSPLRSCVRPLGIGGIGFIAGGFVTRHFARQIYDRDLSQCYTESQFFLDEIKKIMTSDPFL